MELCEGGFVGTGLEFHWSSSLSSGGSQEVMDLARFGFGLTLVSGNLVVGRGFRWQGFLWRGVLGGAMMRIWRGRRMVRLGYGFGFCFDIVFVFNLIFL